MLKDIVMGALDKRQGNVYEILLPNNKYVYVCLISKFNFGVFNYFSETSTQDIKLLLSKGFKLYQSCKETAINKKIWKLVGKIDLEAENIFFPDLAIFTSWNVEHSFRESKVMSDGNPKQVDIDYYKQLVKKGFIYGFFNKYSEFETWLSLFMEDYPNGILDFTIMSERMKGK